MGQEHNWCKLILPIQMECFCLLKGWLCASGLCSRAETVSCHCHSGLGIDYLFQVARSWCKYLIIYFFFLVMCSCLTQIKILLLGKAWYQWRWNQGCSVRAFMPEQWHLPSGLSPVLICAGRPHFEQWINLIRHRHISVHWSWSPA